jgi:hypothetical protein
MENDLTDLLSKNSNKKLEEKINFLSESIYNLFSAVQIMMDGIDNNLSCVYSSVSNLEYKTSCLENQIIYLKNNINEISNAKKESSNVQSNYAESISKNPAPPVQQAQKPNPANIRKDIMNELQEILKRRKMMEANEEDDE